MQLPDWAHFEVAEHASTEGKIGVAVDILDTLRDKQDKLQRASMALRPASVAGAGSASADDGVPPPPLPLSLVPDKDALSLGRIDSVAAALSGGGEHVLHDFDPSAAQLFRIKFYIRRLYDSCTYPIWRRSKCAAFREHLHARMTSALAQAHSSGGGGGMVATVSPSKASAARRWGSGGASGGDGGGGGGGDGGGVESDSDGDSDDDGGGNDGWGGGNISERQLAASDDVARTVNAVDRLLECLHRMLCEIALAFPKQRNEFLRHASLTAQTIYLTVVSEIGRHIGSAEAIGGVTMQALLMLLDVLLKRNRCVEEVGGRK